MTPNRIKRRRFVQTAALTAAAPVIVPSSVFGQNAPSNRVVLGTIGIGGMGRGNTNSFLRNNDCQVVAVCDVDANNLAKGKGMVDGRYKNSDCKAYKDYRELLARKDIDAVCIATPDHWHGLTCVAAANAKKDIYCQKPMTHTFAEGQAVVAAVKKNDRIFQVGSQQRSGGRFRWAAEMALNERVGKIKHIEVGLPTGHKNSPKAAANQTPPAHLDYDFWCGPSKKLAYMKERLHFQWRWVLAYGGGQLMDWIGHHNDIAHWGMGWDQTGPVEVEAVEFEYPADRSVFDAAWQYKINCTYASGVTSSISNKFERGCKWIGENGAIFVSRGRFRIHDKAGKEDKDATRQAAREDYDRGPKKAYKSPEHHRNFLDGVKTRKQCICPAETGHRSITPGHLGLVSQAVGRKLKWDPKAEKIAGDPEAEALLKSTTMRSPWTLA
ncbi:MAG: Gfo/Idh/MocA family oxidoreductase [Phycisphaerae bacterium]|nr:Gfo/Idh/MocA family oxidoreductase [Phycisphaerae bacterium]